MFSLWCQFLSVAHDCGIPGNTRLFFIYFFVVLFAFLFIYLFDSQNMQTRKIDYYHYWNIS